MTILLSGHGMMLWNDMRQIKFELVTGDESFSSTVDLLLGRMVDKSMHRNKPALAPGTLDLKCLVKWHW